MSSDRNRPLGRPYQLRVIDGGAQAPGSRYFDSLAKVWAAFDNLKPALQERAEVRVRSYVLIDRDGVVRLDA